METRYKQLIYDLDWNIALNKRFVLGLKFEIQPLKLR